MNSIISKVCIILFKGCRPCRRPRKQLLSRRESRSMNIYVLIVRHRSVVLSLMDKLMRNNSIVVSASVFAVAQ